MEDDFKPIYHTINENDAWSSRQYWSMREYSRGEETASYRKQVDEVYSLALKAAEKNPENKERAFALAERYSRKLAENINHSFKIEMMCPSVLISGGSNFPVKKKMRQNSARETNYAERKKIEEIRNKINGIYYNNAIKSDDINAIEKLEKKIEEKKNLQEEMKLRNSYFKKNKTMKDYPGITEEQAAKMDQDIANGVFYKDRAYAPYELQNNNQEIHRLEKRLDNLKNEKNSESFATQNEVCEIVENVEQMRIQLKFENKPEPEERDILKSHAFKWSPRNNVWQRMLNNNGRYAAAEVMKEIADKRGIVLTRSAEITYRVGINAGKGISNDCFEYGIVNVNDAIKSFKEATKDYSSNNLTLEMNYKGKDILLVSENKLDFKNIRENIGEKRKIIEDIEKIATELELEIIDVEKPLDVSMPEPELKLSDPTEEYKPHYAILQIHTMPGTENDRFESLSWLNKKGKEPDPAQYEIIHCAPCKDIKSYNAFCESIYSKFNGSYLQPADYYGTSVSVSDVIVTGNNEKDLRAYFCDDAGFKELPETFITKDIKDKFLKFQDVKKEMETLSPESSRYKEIETKYTKIFEMAAERGKMLEEKESKLEAADQEPERKGICCQYGTGKDTFYLSIAAEQDGNRYTFYDNTFIKKISEITEKEDIETSLIQIENEFGIDFQERKEISVEKLENNIKMFEEKRKNGDMEAIINVVNKRMEHLQGLIYQDGNSVAAIKDYKIADNKIEMDMLQYNQEDLKKGFALASPGEKKVIDKDFINELDKIENKALERATETYLRIEWSEHGEPFEDNAIMNLDTADEMLGKADIETRKKYQLEEYGGYDKTKFTIVSANNTYINKYVDRYDLGDGYGSLQRFLGKDKASTLPFTQPLNFKKELTSYETDMEISLFAGEVSGYSTKNRTFAEKYSKNGTAEAEIASGYGDNIVNEINKLEFPQSAELEEKRTHLIDNVNRLSGEIQKIKENIAPHYGEAKKALEERSTVLLTGEKVSDELQFVMEQLSENKDVDIELITKTPEMQEAYKHITYAKPTYMMPNRENFQLNALKTLNARGSVSGKDSNGEIEYNGNIDTNRRLDIVVGLPASGKSSAIVEDLSSVYHSRIVDNDEAKKLLPGYDDGWGASIVHEESQGVSENELYSALNAGENIVLPKVGSNAKKLEPIIQEAKANGYTVNVHYVELSRQKAMGRMLGRFVSKGKFLEPTLIDKYDNAQDGNKIERAYEQLKKGGLIDGYSKWNNDVERNAKPNIIESNIGEQFFQDAKERRGISDQGESRHNVGTDSGIRAETSGVSNDGSGRENENNRENQQTRNVTTLNQKNELETKESKFKELENTITQGVQKVLDSNEFKNYLQTSATRIGQHYSFNNAMLIWSQKADARFCKGYEAWKTCGRQVKKGAKGIKIYAPVKAYEKTPGALANFYIKKLKNNYDKDSTKQAIERIGTSRLEIGYDGSNYTVYHSGKEAGIIASDASLRNYFDRKIVSKEVIGYKVDTVFDAKDTYQPETLWVKNNYEKKELVLSESGDPIRNNNGEVKINNFPERMGRFTTSLNMEIMEHSADKMNQLRDILETVSKKRGIEINYSNETKDPELKTSKGYFSMESDGKAPYIMIKENLDPTEKVAVILHEMSHSQMHKNPIPEKDRNIAELQAEASAYVLGQKFGIDTSTSSFKYLAFYTKGTEQQQLKASLNKIYQDSGKLFQDISAELKERNLTETLEPIANFEETKENKLQEIGGIANDKAEKYAEDKKQIIAMLEAETKGANNAELKEIYKKMGNCSEKQLADCNELRKICLEAKEATKQEVFETKIEAAMSIISGLEKREKRFENLTKASVEVVKDRQPVTQYDKYKEDPKKYIDNIENPFMKKLSAEQKSYIIKSTFVKDQIAPLLKNNQEEFVNAIKARMEAVDAVKAKNGTFIEVVKCENIGYNKIMEAGELCHPKSANAIVSQVEKEVYAIKEEAAKNKSFYPAVKAEISYFNLKGKVPTYENIKVKMEIGKQAQKDIAEALEKVKEPAMKNFTDALKERNVLDKIRYYSDELPRKTKEKEEAAEEPGETLTQDEWKKEIASGEKKTSPNEKEENESAKGNRGIEK